MLIDILKIPRIVELGHQSEQNKLTIYFDLKKWLNEYPEVQSGTASIKMELPNGEVLPVLVTNFDKDNAIVEWPIGLTETTIPGRGAADLTITWNDGLAKSYKFITLVYEAVGTGIEPTSYTPDWIDTLIDELQQTRNILDDNRITDENTWSAEKIAEEIATGGTGIPIPKKLSDLTNDTGFIDNAVTDLIYYYTRDETYAKSEVNTLINNIHAMSVVIVPVLPEVGQADIFYLVPREEIKLGNVYDEFLWANNKWEKIGGTPVDTNLYYTKDETDAKLAEKLTPPTVTASDVDKAIIWNGTEWAMGEAGGSGTDNYNDLNNKPKINNVTLQGNISLASLGIPSQEQTYTKDDIDEALENKVDADKVYDKTEIDTALSNKVDTGTVFTKQQVQTLVDQKADAVAVYVKNEVYNKTEVDGKVDALTDALSDKADASSVYSKSETYTKTEIDNKLKPKASISVNNNVVTIADGTGTSEEIYNITKVNDLLGDKTELTVNANGTATISDDTNSVNVYTVTKADQLFQSKASIFINGTDGTATISNGAATPVSATVYSKAKVDDLLSTKANLQVDSVYQKINLSVGDTSATTYNTDKIDAMVYAKLDNPNPTPDDDGKYIKYQYDASTGMGSWVMGSGQGGGGTTVDYTDLENKPKINNVILTGNKTSADVKVADTVVINNVDKTLSAGTSKINLGDVVTGVKVHNSPLTIINGVVNVEVDYEDVDNQPSINDVTLVGNKSLSDLGIVELPSDFLEDYAQLKEDVYYEEPSITSFTITPSTTKYEIGTTVSSVVFNWVLNKAVESQKFDNTTIDKTLRTKTISDVNATKTYKIVVTDNKSKTAEASKTISFMYKRYYKASTVPSAYNDAFLLGMTGELSSNGKGQFTVNAGSGQYIFFAWPTSYGNPRFFVGGFEGGFSKVATFNHTNASGATTSYDVYKSTNANLSQTVVDIQ